MYVQHQVISFLYLCPHKANMAVFLYNFFINSKQQRNYVEDNQDKGAEDDDNH